MDAGGAHIGFHNQLVTEIHLPSLLFDSTFLPATTRHNPQALLCLGDLVSEHAKNQDALAHSAVRVRARPAGPAAPGPSSPGGQRGGLGYFTPPPQPMSMWGSPQKSQWQQLPALHAALRTALVSPSPHEAAAAMQLIGAFCRGNPEGQVALASTFAPSSGARGSSSMLDNSLGLGALMFDCIVQDIVHPPEEGDRLLSTLKHQSLTPSLTSLPHAPTPRQQWPFWRQGDLW